MKNDKINIIQYYEDEEFAVTGPCTGCGKCLYVCPADCIRSDGVPYSIDPSLCRQCGNCAEICPVGAIHRI